METSRIGAQNEAALDGLWPPRVVLPTAKANELSPPIRGCNRSEGLLRVSLALARVLRIQALRIISDRGLGQTFLSIWAKQ